MKAIKPWNVLLLTAAFLTACGGSSSSDDNKEPPTGGGNNGGENGGDNNSGNPHADVRSATIDASSDWAYFDLENGTVVDAPTGTNWHIAFNRYNVKTNGGISGSGTVGSFLAQVPADFYDESGKVIESKLTDETALKAAQALLTNTQGWTAWTSNTKWAIDSANSALNPAYKGSYPSALNYGFYSYDPVGTEGRTKHSIFANADHGVLLKSGEGNSYARVKLTDISYADATVVTSQRTYTFDFDVQPNGASSFTQTAQWITSPSANNVVCFDFDANNEVNCEGNNWDLKLNAGATASAPPSFFTNSGPSGEGKGAALGSPFAYTWAQLAQFSSGLKDHTGATISPMAYLSDTVKNAFSSDASFIGSAVFEYVTGHKILSNHSVFLVTADNSKAFTLDDANVFAVQFTNYYGGNTGAASGYPTIRWVKVSDLQ